jgi:DegV family protein with EDD domain
MDQVMPEMDGTECLRKLRQQIGSMCRDVPVVVVTAFASPDDQAKYRLAGFDGYMLKPVNIEMLENMLLRMLPADLIHKSGEINSDGESIENSMKHKYKIPLMVTTESVCDLPSEVIDRMRIPVIPFAIRNKNGSFIDGLETESEGVLEYMREGGALDTFAEEPPIEAYEEFFAASLENADNIIHISMSGKLGRAYGTALEAASSFDKVHVIDSESISSGMGLLVLEAVKFVEGGMDVQKCIEQIDITKKQINSSFLINSPDYLIKNGRVNPRVKGISRVLMMHPAITFRDGRGTLERMFFGQTEKIRKKYVKTRFDSSRKVDLGKLFITHTGLSLGEVEDIKRWVNDEITFKEIVVQKESAATAAMHGDGTFGLLFMYEKDR